MELPIAPQTYQPSADALVRAIKRVQVILARMVAQETVLDVATVLHNADHPRVHMVNFAADVRLTENISAQAALDQIEAAFAQVGTRCHLLLASETTWPNDLARAAEARGFAPSERQVMLLHSYRAPAKVRDDLQIIPGRAAYALLRRFYAEAAVQQGRCDAETAAQLADVHIGHLDEPRLELFLARHQGQVVGAVALVTLGQIGVIEWVYTAPHMRRKNVARTLLAHTMEHCQRALFEQVILEVEPTNPARTLYESLGFQTVTPFINYQRS